MVLREVQDVASSTGADQELHGHALLEVARQGVRNGVPDALAIDGAEGGLGNGGGGSVMQPRVLLQELTFVVFSARAGPEALGTRAASRPSGPRILSWLARGGGGGLSLGKVVARGGVGAARAVPTRTG